MLAGRISGLAALYDRYGAPAYSIAFTMLKDGTLAEEVVKDTFLELWQRTEPRRPAEEEIAIWLLSTAHDRAVARAGKTEPCDARLALFGPGERQRARPGAASLPKRPPSSAGRRACTLLAGLRFHL